MLVPDADAKRGLVLRLLDEPPQGQTGNLHHIAARILADREAILRVARSKPTPFYLYDPAAHAAALTAFDTAFSAELPHHQPFFAVKSNHEKNVVQGAVAAGYGLDVSSGRELAQALKTKAPQILFSGPAKSPSDLETAIAAADRVTVNIDSFRELERLVDAAERQQREIRAGVRIYTKYHGSWSKFGIPLEDLARFWRAAAEHPAVRLEGIQFHLSWNRNAEPYCNIIRDLAAYLEREFSLAERMSIRFIDIGGGYRPHANEGYYPGDVPQAALYKTAAEHYGEAIDFVEPYYIKDSIPIADYAAVIGGAVRERLAHVVDAQYYTEPGRIVATDAMHLVLRVVDRKRDDLVIVDGGINMVGWERYLHIYAPVVNLTHPADVDRPLRVYGSLCDPEDVFAYHVYTAAVEEGDVLVIPYQGAYTYCVAQDFIRPIPKVYRLPAGKKQGKGGRSF